MKTILITLALFCASCASTEKLLQTKSQREVVIIEKNRFNARQLPNKREYRIYVISAFAIISLVTCDGYNEFIKHKIQ